MKKMMTVFVFSMLSFSVWADDVKTFASTKNYDIQIQVSTCRDQVSVFYSNMDWGLFGSYLLHGTLPKDSSTEQYQVRVGGNSTVTDKTLEMSANFANFDHNDYRLLDTRPNTDCR
jgi:hypothetical protein